MNAAPGPHNGLLHFHYGAFNGSQRSAKLRTHPHPAKRTGRLRIANLRQRMQKDYYRILELSPQASADEIRRSFRRLAMEWHPDRKGDNTRFLEIREAYETLIDPARKTAYLQTRADEEALGRRFGAYERPSPATILKKALQLEREVSSMDAFRMDGESLLASIAGCLDEESVETILRETDTEFKSRLTVILLNCGRPLESRQAQRLAAMLARFGGEEAQCKDKVDVFLKRKRMEGTWERWRTPVLVALTLLICLLIYIVGA